MRRNPDSGLTGGEISHSEAPGGIQGAAPLLTLGLKRLPGTKCLCGKCKTCGNRRYSATWRKNHPGPAHLARVRRNGVATTSITSWANLRRDSTERAVAASAKANHYPGRFADWSVKRLAELRAKWAEIKTHK